MGSKSEQKRCAIRGLVLLLVILCGQTDSFKCLPKCVCTGVNITCSNEHLMNVPHFETINGANIVDLSNNEIEEVDEKDFQWNGIEQLQFLYLNINSIVYIHEEAFATLRNLEYLDLSNNGIEYLPSRIFENNGRLTTVNLAGNLFGKNVPTIFSKTIQHLDLSFAKLATFTEENLRYLPNLLSLNLQANNIIYVNPKIFPKHLNLILSYNIWACNCSTIDIYNWAISNENVSIDDPIKCMNKNNIYIDMFKKSDPYIYKESCNINEDTFGLVVPNPKEFSLVKADHLKEDNLSYEESESNFYGKATTIFVIIVILIVGTAVAVGVVLGFYISFNMQRRRRESGNRLMS